MLPFQAFLQRLIVFSKLQALTTPPMGDHVPMDMVDALTVFMLPSLITHLLLNAEYPAKASKRGEDLTDRVGLSLVSHMKGGGLADWREGGQHGMEVERKGFSRVLG